MESPPTFDLKELLRSLKFSKESLWRILRVSQPFQHDACTMIMHVKFITPERLKGQMPPEIANREREVIVSWDESERILRYTTRHSMKALEDAGRLEVWLADYINEMNQEKREFLAKTRTVKKGKPMSIMVVSGFVLPLCCTLNENGREFLRELLSVNIPRLCSESLDISRRIHFMGINEIEKLEKFEGMMPEAETPPKYVN